MANFDQCAKRSGTIKVECSVNDKGLLILPQQLRVDDFCWVRVSLREQRKKLALCLDDRPVDRWITQPDVNTLIERQSKINCPHLCIEVQVAKCGDRWNETNSIAPYLAKLF